MLSRWFAGTLLAAAVPVTAGELPVAPSAATPAPAFDLVQPSLDAAAASRRTLGRISAGDVRRPAPVPVAAEFAEAASVESGRATREVSTPATDPRSRAEVHFHFADAAAPGSKADPTGPRTFAPRPVPPVTDVASDDASLAEAQAAAVVPVAATSAERVPVRLALDLTQPAADRSATAGPPSLTEQDIAVFERAIEWAAGPAPAEPAGAEPTSASDPVFSLADAPPESRKPAWRTRVRTSQPRLISALVDVGPIDLGRPATMSASTLPAAVRGELQGLLPEPVALSADAEDRPDVPPSPLAHAASTLTAATAATALGEILPSLAFASSEPDPDAVFATATPWVRSAEPLLDLRPHEPAPGGADYLDELRELISEPPPPAAAPRTVVLLETPTWRPGAMPVAIQLDLDDDSDEPDADDPETGDGEDTEDASEPKLRGKARPYLIPPAPDCEYAGGSTLEGIFKPITAVTATGVSTAPPTRRGDVDDNLVRPDNAACAYLEIGAPAQYTLPPQLGVKAPFRDEYCFTHNPLYFEDPNLERCGETQGCLTSARAASLFFAQAVLLPYQMTRQCPRDCVEALPDCPTCARFGPEAYLGECSREGVAVQTAVVTGLFFLIP